MFLAEQGLDVRSIELSPLAIAKARDLAASRGVTVAIEQADVLHWTWPVAQFLIVIAAIFIQFAGAEARPRIFAGIKQALWPGGLAADAKAMRPSRSHTAPAGRAGRQPLYPRAAAGGVRGFRLARDPRHDDVDPRGRRAFRHVGADRYGGAEVAKGGITRLAVLVDEHQPARAGQEAAPHGRLQLAGDDADADRERAQMAGPAGAGRAVELGEGADVERVGLRARTRASASSPPVSAT